jgi:hypothetical protein
MPSLVASDEVTIYDVKGSFYEELERVFDKFTKYHMKILLGDFNAEVGEEDIIKPIIGNESLHEISNDNGVLNFPTSKQGRLQGCAACAAAQGAERVGAPIPNHKYENSRALYGCRLEHNRKESEWKANRKHRN